MPRIRLTIPVLMVVVCRGLVSQLWVNLMICSVPVSLGVGADVSSNVVVFLLKTILVGGPGLCKHRVGARPGSSSIISVVLVCRLVTRRIVLTNVLSLVPLRE